MDAQVTEANWHAKSSAIRLSIATALFLTLLKLTVGLFSRSLGLMASAVDSLMDVFVSSVNLFSLKEAEKPADREHLYGHGKIESLAGLFQSFVIGASGIYLVAESARRLMGGARLTHIAEAVGVMVVSAMITFFLVRKLKQVRVKTESIIVRTEALHFTTDFLTNGGVIVALILVQFTGLIIWDLLIALIIAYYILSQSWRILKAAIDELLDRALPVEEQKEIERIITSCSPKIVGFHNLRTRKIGHQKFIDFHIEIRGESNFPRAHDLTEALIKQICARFPGSDVTVHFDPEGGE